MRKLSSKELYHGIFVQSSGGEDVYKILIKKDKTFYTVEGADWEQNGELVKDNWYETEVTKSLNKKDIRHKKLKELGI